MGWGTRPGYAPCGHNYRTLHSEAQVLLPPRRRSCWLAGGWLQLLQPPRKLRAGGAEAVWVLPQGPRGVAPSAPGWFRLCCRRPSQLLQGLRLVAWLLGTGVAEAVRFVPHARAAAKQTSRSHLVLSSSSSVGSGGRRLSGSFVNNTTCCRPAVPAARVRWVSGKRGGGWWYPGERMCSSIYGSKIYANTT